MKFKVHCSICNKSTLYESDSPFLLSERLNSLLTCPCSLHSTDGGFLRWVSRWERIDIPSETLSFPKQKPTAEGYCTYRGVPFHVTYDSRNGNPISIFCLDSLFGLLKPEIEDTILEMTYPWED